MRIIENGTGFQAAVTATTHKFQPPNQPFAQTYDYNSNDTECLRHSFNIVKNPDEEIRITVSDKCRKTMQIAEALNR